MYYHLINHKNTWHFEKDFDFKKNKGIVKKYMFWSFTDFCNDTIELLYAEIMLIEKGKITRRAKIVKPKMKLTFEFE